MIAPCHHAEPGGEPPGTNATSGATSGYRTVRNPIHQRILANRWPASPCANALRPATPLKFDQTSRSHRMHTRLGSRAFSQGERRVPAAPQEKVIYFSPNRTTTPAEYRRVFWELLRFVEKLGI